MITDTHEPLRSIYCPDELWFDAWCQQTVFGSFIVHYGASYWRTRSYWYVPNTLREEG